MKKKTIGIVISTLALCNAVSAADISALDIEAQQGFLSFNVLKDNVPINGGATIVSPLEGFWSSGPNNGYPRITCVNGGRAFDSVTLFSGLTVTHKVVGNEVVLDLAQYEVFSPEAEIGALKESECHNLSPRQHVALKKTVKLPYKKTGHTNVVNLENSYSLRYEILPPISIR